MSIVAYCKFFIFQMITPTSILSNKYKQIKNWKRVTRTQAARMVLKQVKNFYNHNGEHFLAKMKWKILQLTLDSSNSNGTLKNFDISRVRVFEKFDKNSKNWHRWLSEAFFFFYLLLKKSFTTFCFKLSTHSRSNKFSMFSTRERLSSPRVLNMERPCSVSITSSTSLVEGPVGGVLSSSS